ncbi:MAG: hypothetical protein B7733_10570 [Myxococcales bacterium FL481]|nr:MAG: hypothetical protein B7733_10570 [Myxococcales bacterium FL481]
MQGEPDFSAHMRRKRLRSYEFELAARAYAYGVDLRRTRWLFGSSLGGVLVRRVDRAWPSVVAELERDHLRPTQWAFAPSVLELLDEVTALLHCVRPLLRAVSSPEPWPVATPLAPAHGGEPWLLLNVARLDELAPSARAFAIGSALAHAQCGHGALFAAHWLAARDRRQAPVQASWFRRLIRPWTAVAAFSADRAGLLACRDLDVAIAGIERELADSEAAAWWPTFAGAEPRARALRDFDHSLSMARVRAVGHHLVDMTHAVESPTPGNGPPTNASTDPRRDSSDTDQDSDPTSDVGPATAGEDEPVGVPPDAWSLARCDQRLTERLGLY